MPPWGQHRKVPETPGSSVSPLTEPTWALTTAPMDLLLDPCPPPQPNPAREWLCRGDRAAVSPLTCGEDTDPAVPCHSLADVPSAGSGGLLRHIQDIVVAVRASLLGPARGIWDRHRAPWQGPAALAGLCLCHPLRPCHCPCAGGPWLPQGQPMLRCTPTRAALVPSAPQPSCVLCPPAPRWAPALWPYLGLPRCHSPPRCPRCHGAAS